MNLTPSPRGFRPGASRGHRRGCRAHRRAAAPLGRPVLVRALPGRADRATGQCRRRLQGPGPVLGGSLPPIAVADYVALVDFTGRRMHPRKRGRIAETEPPALRRLGLDAGHWTMQVKGIGSGYWPTGEPSALSTSCWPRPARSGSAGCAASAWRGRSPRTDPSPRSTPPRGAAGARTCWRLPPSLSSGNPLAPTSRQASSALDLLWFALMNHGRPRSSSPLFPGPAPSTRGADG
jgi:hypothetical protein